MGKGAGRTRTRQPSLIVISGDFGAICSGDRQGCLFQRGPPKNPENLQKKALHSGYLWVISYNSLICGILIMHVFFWCQLLPFVTWTDHPKWRLRFTTPEFLETKKIPPTFWVTRSEEPGGQTVDVGGFPMPIGSMYVIFTYIWLIFMVNVGKYTIHGSYGMYSVKLVLGKETSHVKERQVDEELLQCIPHDELLESLAAGWSWWNFLPLK